MFLLGVALSLELARAAWPCGRLSEQSEGMGRARLPRTAECETAAAKAAAHKVIIMVQGVARLIRNPMHHMAPDEPNPASARLLAARARAAPGAPLFFFPTHPPGELLSGGGLQEDTDGNLIIRQSY